MDDIIGAPIDLSVYSIRSLDDCLRFDSLGDGTGYAFHWERAAIYSRKNRFDGGLDLLPTTVFGDLPATQADRVHLDP